MWFIASRPKIAFFGLLLVGSRVVVRLFRGLDSIAVMNQANFLLKQ